MSKQTMFINDKIGDIANSLGLYSSEQLDEFNGMIFTGYLDIHNTRDNCKEYIFMTRPELNIFDDNNGNILNADLKYEPLFSDLFRRRKPILASLQRSCNVVSGKYINLLFNRVQNTLEMPSITSKEVETSANVYGTSISHRKHSLSSSENHEFTLEFSDNASSDVYLFFKAWDEYNNLKSLGIVKPKRDYIIKRQAHDKIAIYKFIVADDGFSIIFYAKMVGVRPTGAPREAFSELTGKTVYNVPFKADFVFDNNPILLEDFNMLALTGPEIKLYDDRNMRMTSTPARSAKVVINDKKSNGMIYELKWIK